MKFQGLQRNAVFIIIGLAVIIIGVVSFSNLNLSVESEPSPEELVMEPGEEGSVEESAEPTSPQQETNQPKPGTGGQSGTSGTGTGAVTPPPATGGGATTPPSTETPEETPTPDPTPEPTPTPTPYNPGFLASSRITPEIPSENERATLPACDSKLFTASPVELSVVTSVTANGSTNSAGIFDYAVFRVSGSGELNMYDLYAPGDVWITHIAQETGVSADSEDTTIYFALCKDVIGYITNVKELSSDTYKLITDSYCLGKPHTGPNACHIEVLKQVSQGSSLGKVGRLVGTFGLGVIDLRKPLANASTAYPVRTNFAVCPFEYFTGSSGYYLKLQSSTSLCAAP